MLQFPDVVVHEFRPRDTDAAAAGGMNCRVSPALARAVQRYLSAMNKINKQINDVNFIVDVERISRRHATLGDVADVLAHKSLLPLSSASVPSVMYAQNEYMELHRTMLATRTLKDTLDNWVLYPASFVPVPAPAAAPGE